MANTTRGRVIREVGLAALIGVIVIPWAAARANSTARLASDAYGWDPVGIVAGSSELRMHSLGEDRWQVWVCDTAVGTVAVDVHGAVATLNQQVAPYFDWISDGAYAPVFTAGGYVEDDPTCESAVRDSLEGEPNGVLIVTDMASNGGTAQSGIWCPYQASCPASPETYPANYRSVQLGAYAVVGQNPRLVTVVHELGHTLHFGHIFSAATTGTWEEYDDPTDVMSKAGDRTQLMGTSAFHRYVAGWIAPYDVQFMDEPGSFPVSPVGVTGDQLLVIPNGEQGWYTTIGARIQDGYDVSLPVEGVVVHTVDQRPEACGGSLPCFGLSRRISQWPPAGNVYDHVLGVGEELTLVDGRLVRVVERRGDSFTVELVDPRGPLFQGPVRATGVEDQSVALTWPPATGASAYEVSVDGTVRDIVEGTETTIGGLEPARSYEIRVTAFDLDGNRASAPPLQVRTLSARAGVGVHDPATGRWALQMSDGDAHAFYYGIPGDVPMMCDWDGDGVDTVGLYRPMNGFVYLRNSNTIGFADVSFFYGMRGDRPVCGDWDGDGVDTPGVYRPAESRFYLRNSNTLGFADQIVELGRPGDHPFAGDWDGDGRDSVALFRESTGYVAVPDGAGWYVGGRGESLVVADWDGDGADSFSSFGSGTFTLVNPGADGASQQLVSFGGPGHTPIAGWWGP